MFHVKQCSWNTIRIRFGKAGAHPQLAWESQLPLKPCLSLQPFNFKGNCDSSDSLLDFCFLSLCSFNLLRKCGLLAHTSPTFLKNCWIKKLFILPAARFFQPFRIRKAFYFSMTFHVKHFSFLFLENHSKNRKSLPILQHFVEFQKIFSDFYEIALQNFTISCKIVKQCPLLSGHKYIFLETNRQKSTGEEAANA